MLGAGRSPAPPRSSGLDGLLERRGGLEARHLRRGDLDRLAGLRVAALARRALGDGELAEARQADLVAVRQLIRDLLERRLDRFLGLAVAQPGLVGDRACELGLVDGAHGDSSWDGGTEATVRGPRAGKAGGGGPGGGGERP